MAARSRQSRVLGLLFSLTICLVTGLLEQSGWSCTTAVISGRVTADGRPLLWKNRDTSDRHNEVVLMTGGRYRAVAVVNAGSQDAVWMGVNEAGFCIENSLSLDLTEPQGKAGPGNGGFMKRALETCATVADFQKLLDDTQLVGRRTQANFGVIDAAGGAAMFETGADRYLMLDANDPAHAPAGYIVRSNFSTLAQGLPAHPQPDQLTEIRSGERYLRACELFASRDQEPISLAYLVRNLTRDLADPTGKPVPGSINGSAEPLPDTIATDRTISRTTTVSAAVFQGVKSGESALHTTMWVLLGDPKFSIAVPCWADVETVADDLTDPQGGELGEIAITLRDWHLTHRQNEIDTHGLPGIWQDVWPQEDRMLHETRQQLDLAGGQSLARETLTKLHHQMVSRAMNVMERELTDAKDAALRHTLQPNSQLPLRVAIYDHAKTPSSGPRNLMTFLTPDQGFHCERIRPQQIREGKLSEFQVLIMPGGSASRQAEMLEDSGRAAIRSFVKEGGSYVGICAGSYLASTNYAWSLRLINARVWDRAHWARGTGTASLRLTRLGQASFAVSEPVVEVYYGQGPLLLPANDPELPRYEVLASYHSEVVQGGAPVGVMQGTHAIIRGTYGRGRVICFSPHPEKETGPRQMITSGVLWSVGREPQFDP
jgi:glutamine amidotransferase-like uncharacterized protein